MISSSSSIGRFGQVPAGWSRVFMAPRPMSPLQKGQANDQVRDLQLLINTLGYGVPVTGSFDAPTEVAVRIMQGKLGQTMTGAYDPALDSTVLDNYQAKFSFKQSIVLEADANDKANVKKMVPTGYVAPTNTGTMYVAPQDPVPQTTTTYQNSMPVAPGLPMPLIAAGAVAALGVVAVLARVFMKPRRSAAPAAAAAAVAGLKNRKRRSKRSKR